MLVDLAHMVESELRINALTDNQKALMAQASRDERKRLLDPQTGCWSEGGFIELLRRTLVDVRAGAAYAALCGFHIQNEDDFVVTVEKGGSVAKAMLIAQFIRQRLPGNAVMCRMPGGRGCILFAARDKDLVREQVATFLQEPGFEPVAGMVFPQKMQLLHSGLRLDGAQASQDPELLFEMVMGRLAEGTGMTSVLR